MDITFNVKKFSNCNEPDSEILKQLPMLIRRKLSNLDKLALTNILKVYDEGIENVVFSSQYGEFERLFKLIEQHKSENEVSPIQFSSSVHNYLTGVLSLSKNITVPYYAVSAGEKSFENGLITAAVSKKTTLFCYTDTLKTPQSFACIITPEPVYTLKNFNEFLESLND